MRNLEKSMPVIRFKGFSEAWEQRKLGDIANYRNGKAHEQVEDEDGKYTIINSKFISTNGKVQRYTNEQVEPIFDGEIAMVLSDLPNGKALAKLFLVK
ncbi:restriction endonuclease subunit S, partial [Listeria monocytogenes]|nr:restriction endonuclease subunit S [Listeria monocytogenes]